MTLLIPAGAPTRTPGASAIGKRPVMRRRTASGPARGERPQVGNRALVRVAARVDGAEHDLVLEYQVAHDEVGVELDRALAPRHAGEDEHAVGAEHLHQLERHPGRAGRLVDEVDVADRRRELGEGVVLGGQVGRAHRCDQPGLVVRPRGARVHRRRETGVDQHHRAEQPHRARPEHHGPQAVRRRDAGRRRGDPRQPLLDLPDLGDRLFGDGQRLGKHGHVAQRPRDQVHVALVVDHELGHEAVRAGDPALGEVAGVAEVLAAGAAGGALGVRARPAHHRDREVADLDARDRGPDLDDLAERLVADHEVGRTRRRRAVLERHDLAVGAADADLEHPQSDVGGRGEDRLRVIDQADLTFGGEDGNGSHFWLPFCWTLRF